MFHCGWRCWPVCSCCWWYRCFDSTWLSFASSADSNCNQSINPSINQSTNQSVNQSIHHSINQSISQSINQLTNQSPDKAINSIIIQPKSPLYSIILSIFFFSLIHLSIKSQPIYQSNQSINHQIKQLLDESLNKKSVSQSFYQSKKQTLISSTKSQSICQSIGHTKNFCYLFSN